MRCALMVAEKPSLAAALAKILSNGKNSTRKGSNGACSVHEWVGYFRGDNVRFKMTSVCGHVMTLDFIGKYNNWDKVDPAELFTCPTEKKEATPKLKMPSFLHHEAKGCDYLVLWLDCDKEGENICFEVMNAVKSALNRPLHVHDVVWRAKFSAITDRDIKAAMENLVKPNENEARSVDARQELDLRIGCAFTRFQTKFFQGKYGDLDASLISYGPCQTPTLGFCVERHDAIQTFKPEPFWYIQVNVENPNGGDDLTLQWSRGYLFDREVASALYVEMRDETTVEVTNVVTKEKAKARPQALNTVELMRVGSSYLDMGPHHVMLLAEKLYTQGYISYPRTETTHYPDSFNLLAVVKQQQNSAEVGKEVSNILANGINKPRSGHDAGDHPPITPMKLAHRNEMDNEMYKIYNYIVRHFLATVERDCKYLSTTVTFDVKGESFHHTGKTLLEMGYTVVMPHQAISKNEIVPDIKKGDKVRVKLVKLCEGQTSPPSYLSEAELITLMEKHGIGTDASIPVHINNISQRNYVSVAAGRRLVPTNLGIVLVHGYQKIDPELVLPTMRAAVEEQLNLIAHGKVDFKEILDHTLVVFHLKFLYFVQHIGNMDQLFEVSFSTLANTGKAMSRCGKCRRYMKYIQAKPSRLHCSHCDETYSLPQNGNVRSYKELKCPLDEFEMIYFSTGVKGKSFPLCPYCYNNPPFREMRKGSGCNQCVHPTCAHSVFKNSLSECIQCDEGILVLDPPSAPKWKLVCNKCDVIIHLFENAQKVSIEESNCGCGAQQVKVEYKEDKTKLPKDATEMVGCVFCSPEFLPLVEKHKAIASKPANFARKGGKGARSKHKGKSRPPKDKMAQLAAYFV